MKLFATLVENKNVDSDQFNQVQTELFQKHISKQFISKHDLLNFD